MYQYVMPGTKKEKSEVKALMELIKAVAEVTATEEKICEHEESNIGTLLWR